MTQGKDATPFLGNNAPIQAWQQEKENRWLHLITGNSNIIFILSCLNQ